MRRRALLAGAPGAVLLMGTGMNSVHGSQNPDSELILACAEHARAYAAVNAAAYDILDDRDPLWASYVGTRRVIEGAVPQTMAGLRAKAKAAKLEANGGAEGPAAEWALDVADGLLRLTGRSD